MKRLVLVLTMFAAWLVVSGSGASAGGWAVTSVDELPSPRAGGAVDVGFTVRQHGVTPANVDGDVGIEITGSSGESEFFPADPSGAPGHYVARVVFPTQGQFSWAVRQGWFGDQDLGTIEVAGPAGGVDPARPGAHRWPAAARFGLPAVAVLLASVVVADLAMSARRRRPGVAAG